MNAKHQSPRHNKLRSLLLIIGIVIAIIISLYADIFAKPSAFIMSGSANTETTPEVSGEVAVRQNQIRAVGYSLIALIKNNR